MQISLDSKRIKNFLTQNAIYLVLLALIVIIAMIDVRFISITCLKDILGQSSTRAIIALGAAFILV